MESFQVVIIRHLLNIEKLITAQGEKMALDFTKLEAEVTAAVALLAQLSAALKALSGSTSDVTTQAELDKLAGELDAAIAANQPPAPPAPTPAP